MEKVSYKQGFGKGKEGGEKKKEKGKRDEI